MTAFAIVAVVSISVVGIIVGLLCAALVYFLAEWLLGLMGVPRAQPIAAILAILVFIAAAVY